MNRKREQADLLFKLGAFFGPVMKMMEYPDQYDEDERTRIIARFSFEAQPMINSIQHFTRGEPGHDYHAQWIRMHDRILELGGWMPTVPVDDPRFKRYVTEVANAVTDTLLSIPVPIDSTIYEARTPFTTYCFVKDLCSTVKTQIVWLDRYFDQTIFHRYLTETPKNVLVTLVTLPTASLRNATDQRRRAEFMDISKLFAAERGPTGYRLIENGNFHDRWLRCDDRLFTLGGSIKDLAKPFTISKLDFTPENVKHFEDTISGGTEVFGPAHPTHP